MVHNLRRFTHGNRESGVNVTTKKQIKKQMKTGSNKPLNRGQCMSAQAVSRINAATARQNHGTIPANSFAARAARAAAGVPGNRLIPTNPK